ncbi:alpha-D-glucose phosphate-specific phosphoglucomutase [Ostreibacterium oceani]|uniref:phosphoglucomutase (alpha-D-glucose-1,6-bisphosphate-dependent) n=1 Tax=Ostreibacterium oceani TaxID=2654998 RepID=A0A6N7EVW8_9GAMM|nr:alpha-D-glucose phosphate-specific phosphoglucomutase [Ostreibacterium oceani]MPV86642.1 alpha-D-glucose phosphate-specific phosphoglucomutase [Ostreibacterium oceani]
MNINTVVTAPYADQCPGTSGLRKKTQTFITQANYLENYIQSCLCVVDVDKHQPIIIGGDGRYYNDIAIQQTIRIALGNGFTDIRVCQRGLLSTPACSHLIRHCQATLGFVFSASHNPGGENGDVGIKLNVANGGPAPVSLTDEIYAYSQQISHYVIADTADIDLMDCQYYRFGEARVAVIDGVGDYVKLMQSLFDFALIRDYLTSNRLQFDAMHAITGPYAKAIFVDCLGVDANDILNATPLPDFAGQHPDPSPTTAKTLYNTAMSPDCPFSLLAASDGDGDRNMIVGHKLFVNPSDSLAVIAANHTAIKQFQSLPFVGVARSLPTSRAVDVVANALGIDCYETPTGWKFFGNLLDANRINLCGEESFGTSGHHIREKDGIWAVLCWLSILATQKQSVSAVMQSHWARFGRHYYARYDFEGLSVQAGEQILADLTQKDTKSLQFNQQDCTELGHFSYTDPTNQSHISHQGYQVKFGESARFVVRLSGTGTVGATLRLYLEVFDSDFMQQPDVVVAPLAQHALAFIDLARYHHTTQPTAIVC